MSMTINGTSGLTFNDGSTQPTAANGNLGFRNRIINGAMTISQRGTSFATPADGVYTLDRWFTNTNGGGVFSVAQSSDAPSGFTNSTLITVTTADASIASSDYYVFSQRIEGYNVADLSYGSASAAPVTISFWVKSSVTGTYGVSVLGYNAAYRTYVSTVTINSANTWEYKSFTVSGDTASAIRTNSNWGLDLAFDLGCGSAFNTTAGSWTAGEKYGTSGSTKLISTNGATFYITGVQLEKGSTATLFDNRPYGTELSLCQRYYQTIDATGVVFFRWSAGYANTSMAGYNLPVQMRTSPTFSNSSMTGKNLYNMALDSNASSGTPTFSLNNSSATTAQIFGGDSDSSLGGNAGNPLIVSTTGATFNFSAEL